MKCLIPNIGSTSFKYRLLQMPEERVLVEGKIERIGRPGGECADYAAAIHECMKQVAGEGKALKSLDEIDAVGFKVVHPGGMSGPRLVDESLFRAMEEFAFYAPAHNPPYIAAMRGFGKELPGVPLVAVFETRLPRPMLFHTSGDRSLVFGDMDSMGLVIAPQARRRWRFWTVKFFDTSHVIWVEVPASRRFAMERRSTRALGLPRSQDCRRTTE
jgi:hypothetical protein